MKYQLLRELEKKELNIKMGFDYLPMNYEFMDRHQQNNKYMCAMWSNEDDNLQNAMYELEYHFESVKE